MSPTAAMLMRIALLSGSGGGGGVAGSGTLAATGSVSAASGRGTSTGADAQPASANDAASPSIRRKLVTEPDTQRIDLRCAQPATEHVQFVQVGRRADPDPMIGPVVDRHTLNL